MEKEKRKGKPNRRWILVAVLTVTLSFLGACSYYISQPRILSEFSRFETEEEVVVFLHENFDLYISTSDDILTFMDGYPLMFDECRDSTPSPYDSANNIVDEEVTKIINCTVVAWASIAGTSGYTLQFYIDTDDKLVHIAAIRFCMCL